jgi:MFS superfamily sulfate permease-like transporter
MSDEPARPRPGEVQDRQAHLRQAALLTRFVTELVRSSKGTIGTVILDPGANDELDITSTEVLAKLIEELARREVCVALTHVHATADDKIRRSASDGKPGPDLIFPNPDSAVTWASTRPASSVPRAEEE